MAARRFQVPIDLSKLELQNAVIHTLAGAPTSPVKFQIYGNSTDNTVYWWDGTQWVAAKDAGGAGFGSSLSETTFGTSKTDGVASTMARSDHGHGNPTHVAADHATIPISALATATANLNLGGFVITNSGAPVNPTDVPTKSYVDAAINGLNWKDSCRIASTANLGLSGLSAIDGVTPIAGDRILVKNQTTASANGIYTAAAGAWARSTDADTAAEILQATVFIEEGTQADTAWTCTTNAPITLNTTNLTFAQFGAGAAYIGGAGLVLTGNQFDVVAGDTTLTVAADNVVVNTAVIATRAYADAGAAKRYAIDVGGATAVTVTHNLGTKDVIVQVWDNTTPFAQIECDVEHATVNTVILRFAAAPAAAAFRCVVLA